MLSPTTHSLRGSSRSARPQGTRRRVALALAAITALLVAAGTDATPASAATTTAVTYEANGGTFAAAASATTLQETPGSDADTQAPAATLSGDTLVGWSTSATATTGDAGDTVGTSALTLYAVWAKDYNVIYNANGGAPQETTLAEAAGSDPVSQAPLSSPSFGSNSFLGWSTNKNAQTGDALNTDVVPVGGTVMYAVWRLPSDIQVLFFENNSQLDTHTTWQQSALVDAPSPATLHPESTMTFSNPGFRFVEWCTVEVRDDQACTATAYSDGQMYSFAQDLNLYAVWTNIPLEDVTYSANGGTSADVVWSEQEGTSPLAQAPTTPPTRPGWATSAGAAAPLSPAQALVLVVPASAETLYAVWTPLSYPVDYRANGGSHSSVVVEVLGSDPIAQAPTAPTRQGYSFLGWNTTATATAGARPQQLTVPQDGMSLVAIWRKDATRPSAPRSLRVTPTHDALTVHWSAPASDGGSALTHYTVTLFSARDPHGSVCSAADQLSTVAYCNDLSAATAYRVAVSATNVIGTGPSTTGPRALTPLGADVAPPHGVTRASAPLDVHAQFTGDVASVRWHAPARTGGAPVIVYAVSVPGSPAKCFSTTTSCSIAGLRSNVTYSFLVSAITAAGRGDQGEATSAYHETTLTMEVVPFAFNSAQVTRSMMVQVDAIASTIKFHDVHAATVVGYTDLVGSNTYDLALGEQRGSAVDAALATRLRSLGVAAPFLVTLSRGKQDPVESNYRQTHGGSSRRVTVTMTYFS